MKEKQIKNAVKLFKAQGDKGNPYGYYMIADIMQKQDDNDKFVDYLRLSTESGYLPAIKKLLAWYSEGLNILVAHSSRCYDDLYLEAAQMYNALIYQGDDEALLDLAYFIEEYNSVFNKEEDYKKFFTITKYRAKQYNYTAALALEICYNKGIGTERDSQKASKAIYYEIE